jgi:3-hydroxy-3-methylglutaryl CoA synthase
MSQTELALARGKDPKKVADDYLIETRSLNPPWEDTVTMGANAAKQALVDRNPDEIGMLVVGTEGSVDFGKPISTNIHAALGLRPQVRNFETKHACYSGVAALDCAVNWIASGLNRGRKALVVSTDFSRTHLGKDHEFVLGGCAAAMVIGDQPRIIDFEIDKKGSWTTDIYDTFRPTALLEAGNNEVSLYSYSDAIEGAYRDYVESAGGAVDFETYFDYNIYHMPFPAMAFQAHRILSNLSSSKSKAEVRASFERKVLPSLRFARQVGSMYGSSNFFGLCGLLQSLDAPKPGARIGFFSYGSGAIGEYYSGTVCPGAKEAVARLRFEESLAARRKVSVADYEWIEALRNGGIEKPDYIPDFSVLDGWYNAHYENKGLLVLSEVKDYRRTYRWS